MKPNIFIASSGAALGLARKIEKVLAAKFAPDVWKDGIFELGADTLSELLEFVQLYDFGVVLLTADDLTHSKGTSSKSPRDNVILELGMFLGALGRRRTFPIIVGDLKLPTDLLGNTAIYLPASAAKSIPPAKLKKELQKVIDAIDRRSKESFLQLLPSTGLALGYFQNFVLPVCRLLVEKKVVLVCEQPLEIQNNNFEFHIVLPKTLSDASREAVSRFCALKKLEKCSVVADNRPYPFFITTSRSKGRLILYDYPTTLRASNDCIQLALSQSSLGQTMRQQALDRKEIANFRQTLEILLRRPEAAGFRDKIKIIETP